MILFTITNSKQILKYLLTSKALNCSKQIKTIIFPQQNNDNFTKKYYSTKNFPRHVNSLNFRWIISTRKWQPDGGRSGASATQPPPWPRLQRRRPTRRSAPPAPGWPRWPRVEATWHRLHSAAKHIKNDGSDTAYTCVYNTPTRPSRYQTWGGWRVYLG